MRFFSKILAFLLLFVFVSCSNVENVNHEAEEIHDEVVNEFLPDYIISEKSVIDEFTEKVRQNADANSIVFMQITDTHVGGLSMSLALGTQHIDMACYLSTACNCSFLIHTGDAIHGYEEGAESAEDSWSALISKVGDYSIPFLFAEGNYVHDMGYKGELTRKKVQDYVCGLIKDVKADAVYNENDINSYYYFDDNTIGCRFFILDSQDYGDSRLKYGFSDQQVSFIAKALDDAYEKELPVVFFAHMPPVAELFAEGYDYGMKSNGKKMVDAIGDFSSKGGNVLAYIYGHDHWDNYYYDNQNRIPYICMINDFPSTYAINKPSLWGNPIRYPRSKKGIIQYAMDAYVINSNTKGIKVFRFGAGVNRYINVEPLIVKAGDTATLTTELEGVVQWHSDDERIALCNGGVIEGVAYGTALVTAQDEKGNFEFFNVTCL